ncbi:MAG TPA: 50S ribosomal protein L25/general stress protein Ctc [Gammaproteobacteria bacterium]|nr:50S ribosomal protein L25/general stress protein Ctc [Gammaproteobacteria bacterium]
MQETFELTAEVRADKGKGASRRLRRENGVPAILYGGSAEPQSITLKQNELAHHLEHEAFYSHVLTISIDGKSEKAILRDLQRHPFKAIIMHVDFLRIDEKSHLRMNVPLHFISEEDAAGVKEGGLVTHLSTDVEVSCLAKDLPEYIEIDLSDLEIGESIHLSQIKLPKGVEIVALTHGADHDLAVVSIHKAKVIVEDDAVVASEELAGEEPSGDESGE